MTIETVSTKMPAKPLAAPKRATAIVILGVGRSGTSALTRGIQTLGVDLGDRLRPAGGKNPTGFFEDQDLLALNKRLKQRLGIRGDSIRLLDAALWKSAALQPLRRQAIAIIRQRFGQSFLWGFKYGRTLRMLPFWQGVFHELNLDTRYVVALRNPLSVAHSRSRLNPDRGRQAWSDLEWLVNMVPYFRRLRGSPFTVVDFDALLLAPATQLRRVATMLTLPVSAHTHSAIDDYTQEFLCPHMRHSQFQLEDLEREQGVNPLARDAYRCLYRLAHDEIDPNDESWWRDWAHIEATLAELAPLLEEFDRLRQQLNRARWNPFTPWFALHQAWRDLRSR